MAKMHSLCLHGASDQRAIKCDLAWDILLAIVLAASLGPGHFVIEFLFKSWIFASWSFATFQLDCK